MEIIFEGRKDIINKLREKYPEDYLFISNSFAVDPTTNGKYFEWIGDFLEFSLSRNEHRFTVKKIIEKIIPTFEKEHKRIDKNILDKFIEKVKDYFNGSFDEKELNKIIKNPKDINSYSLNITLLSLMIETLEENPSKRQEERITKKGSRKIFEDEKYLVVSPLTYESSCFYGYNTKWCTASKETRRNWEQYSNDGTLIYFIPKNNPSGKVALYIEKKLSKNRYEVYDSADNSKPISYLYDNFSELTEIIDELVGLIPLLDLLKKYKSGRDDLSIIGMDNIWDINHNDKDRGESKIFIKFNNRDEFVDYLDLYEDDINFLNLLDSYYSEYELYYVDVSEWDDGYISGYFNENNVKLLKDIIRYTFPKYSNIDFRRDYKESNEIFTWLRKTFEDEIDSIINAYTLEMNRIAENGCRDTIERELCDYFEPYGIKKVHERCFNIYETSVNNLINLFEKYYPKPQTIQGLFKVISSDNNQFNWHENLYDMIDYNDFNGKKFNDDIEFELEKILEEISDDENFGKYSDIVNEINKKFTFGVWYDLPRKPSAKFMVDGVDLEDLTIIVKIYYNNNIKDYYLNDLDEFYSLLYNYKLFDDY